MNGDDVIGLAIVTVACLIASGIISRVTWHRHHLTKADRNWLRREHIEPRKTRRHTP